MSDLVFMPEILLLFGAVAALLMDVGFTRISPQVRGNLALTLQCFSVLGAVALLVATRGSVDGPLFDGALSMDRVTQDLKILVYAVAFASIVLIGFSKEVANAGKTEAAVLVLLAAFAASVVVSAQSMIVVFVGFAMYLAAVLILVMQKGGTSSRNDRKVANEAALKLFVSSGVLLVALALLLTTLYSLSGSIYLGEINISTIAAGLSDYVRWGLLVPFFVVLALTFGLFPLHQSLGDTVQSAPTPVSLFMLITSPVLGLALVLKICLHVLSVKNGDAWTPLAGFPWSDLLEILTAVSMTVASLAAILQTNLRRCLAYLALGQLGAIALPLAFPNVESISVSLFGLLGLGLSQIGVAAVTQLILDSADDTDLKALRGVGWAHPFLAASLILFLFGVVGVPPVVGFVGKFYVLDVLIHRGAYFLAALLGLNWVLAIGVVISIFQELFKSQTSQTTLDENASQIWRAPFFRFLVLVSLTPVVVLGVYWQPVIGVISRSLRSVMW